MSVFRRSTIRYGRTPEPEPPYQRAGQVWDERIGSARVQAKNRLRTFPSFTKTGKTAIRASVNPALRPC